MPMNKMTPEEVKVVTEKHLGLVWSIALQFDVPAPWEREDLVHEGYLGLLKAAVRYDGRSAFTTYATPWIRGCILHWFRDSQPLIRGRRKEPPIRCCSLDIPICDEGITLLDLLPSPVLDPVFLSCLSSLPWDSLTKRQLEVFFLLAQGVQLQDIASHLGLSASRVYSIYDQGLTRMKLAIWRQEQGLKPRSIQSEVSQCQ